MGTVYIIFTVPMELLTGDAIVNGLKPVANILAVGYADFENDLA